MLTLTTPHQPTSSSSISHPAVGKLLPESLPTPVFRVSKGAKQISQIALILHGR